MKCEKEFKNLRSLLTDRIKNVADTGKTVIAIGQAHETLKGLEARKPIQSDYGIAYDAQPILDRLHESIKTYWTNELVRLSELQDRLKADLSRVNREICVQRNQIAEMTNSTSREVKDLETELLELPCS